VTTGIITSFLQLNNAMKKCNGIKKADTDFIGTAKVYIQENRCNVGLPCRKSWIQKHPESLL
jgi:hypothetical protein